MAAQDVTLPPIADSVTEGTLLNWHKNAGDYVEKDEPLAEFETDKANVDLPSPMTGVLAETVAKAGDTVRVGDVVARIDPQAKGGTAGEAKRAAGGVGAVTVTEKAPPRMAESGGNTGNGKLRPRELNDLSPAVRRMVSENGLDPSEIPGSGPGGRVTKQDVQSYLDERDTDKGARPDTARAGPTEAAPRAASGTGSLAARPVAGVGSGGQPVRREPMSRIRRRIAQNLVQAQQTAAILTTFNEVDLTRVQELRKQYKEPFEKKHGVGLGFMSFFARAVCIALREFERVNGRIDGDDVIYHDYVNLGIAVSTDRGLTVPVLRNAHEMSFARLESEIKRVAMAVRENKLALEELSGGTFTITNGGVFGSLLSTPILNPPQSGILGMHAIQERPMVVNGEIRSRPMMYVALSYDHRLVDGRESVSFLVRVKQLLEDPSRLLLDV